jgi:hypothetical protein
MLGTGALSLDLKNMIGSGRESTEAGTMRSCSWITDSVLNERLASSVSRDPGSGDGRLSTFNVEARGLAFGNLVSRCGKDCPLEIPLMNPTASQNMAGDRGLLLQQKHYWSRLAVPRSASILLGGKYSIEHKCCISLIYPFPPIRCAMSLFVMFLDPRCSRAFGCVFTLSPGEGAIPMRVRIVLYSMRRVILATITSSSAHQQLSSEQTHTSL